jgi:hypothetical protein
VLIDTCQKDNSGVLRVEPFSLASTATGAAVPHREHGVGQLVGADRVDEEPLDILLAFKDLGHPVHRADGRCQRCPRFS